MESIIELLNSYFFLSQQTTLDFSSMFVLSMISFLGSFLTAAAGIGGGSLVLATMAFYFPPIILMPLHAAVQFGSNIGRTTLMFPDVSKHLISSFAIGTLLGVLIGGKAFLALPTELLQMFLAIFILYSTWTNKLTKIALGKFAFFTIGGFTSFLSMFVGATGPIVAPYVTAACNTRQQIVATHAMLMSIQHGLKLFTFAVLGASLNSYILLLFIMLTSGFIGTYIGKLILKRLPEKLFRYSLKFILTIMALKLFFFAATEKWAN